MPKRASLLRVPPRGKNTVCTALYLIPEDYERLAKVARKMRMPISVLGKRLVMGYVERYEARGGQ